MALETDLQANYEFEGNSNDNSDSNNGTDVSITYSTGNGKYLQGAGFDGSLSTITLTGGIVITQNFTFNGWFKITDNSQTETFLGTAANGVNWFMLTDGKPAVSKNGVAVMGTANSAVPTGAFHMASVTYDGTTVKFYLDGTADGTPASSQTFTTNILSIGHEGTVNKYIGAMDSLSIWNQPKSGSEITTLYANGGGMHFNGSIFVNNVATTAGGLAMF